MLSTGPLRLCVPWDPGIDHAASDITAYNLWRDPKHVVPLPGQAITWYTCQLLRASMVDDMESTIAGNEAKYIRTFAMSVIGVEGRRLPDGGIDAGVWQPIWKKNEQSSGVLTPDERDLFSTRVKKEIGYLVYQASGFFEPGSANFWRPQPWCVDALADQRFLPVARAMRERADLGPATTPNENTSGAPTGAGAPDQ